MNNVVVLEDTNGDGKMDKRTVFADKLVLPRALKVLESGVLVGEPPNLWLMKRHRRRLKADSKELVTDSYGRAANVEHKRNQQPVLGDRQRDLHVRSTTGTCAGRTASSRCPTLSRGQWGASMDDAGRIFRNVNDAPLFADIVAARYYARRNPEPVPHAWVLRDVRYRTREHDWPIRPTRGVTAGTATVLRPDDSSATFTASARRSSIAAIDCRRTLRRRLPGRPSANLVTADRRTTARPAEREEGYEGEISRQPTSASVR